MNDIVPVNHNILILLGHRLIFVVLIRILNIAACRDHFRLLCSHTLPLLGSRPCGSPRIGVEGFVQNRIDLICPKGYRPGSACLLKPSCPVAPGESIELIIQVISIIPTVYC